VTGGSGTESDPYIIENWAIDATGTYGIWIRNCTVHFVVRNCLIENGLVGIHLDNVLHGVVENCEINHSTYYSISSNESSIALLRNRVRVVGSHLRCVATAFLKITIL
jgi:hypothetical protein